MSKLYCFIGFIVLFIGCVSVPEYKALSDDASISADKSYVAGYFNGFPYDLTLKNLDTGEYIKITLKDSDELQISRIPSGDYALIQISGHDFRLFKGARDYFITVPIEYMQILKVRNNTVLYLGEISTEENFFRNPITKIRKGDVYINYDIESAVEDFNKVYIAPQGFKFLSIF